MRGIGYYRRKIIFNLRSYHKDMPINFWSYAREVGIIYCIYILFLHIIRTIKGNVKKQKSVVSLKVSEIEGSFDHVSLEELIRDDDRYKWSQLLLDVEKYGIYFPISVCKFGCDCHKSRIPSNKKIYSCVAGNHRLKIMQILNKGNTTIKVKLDEIPCDGEGI